MAGHSKWSNIKRKKGASDAARGKIFTKIGREITVAVKEGGPDPSSNSKLRDCITKARANNMPNDNITRLIKKASGEVDTVNYEEITYEGYGSGGVAFIVNTLTDNKNRTAGDVRHLFDKYGGSLGTTGCVSFMFDRKGIIIVSDENLDADDFMMQMIDLGAEDIIHEDEVFEITTMPESYTEIKDGIENAGFNILSADIEMIPSNNIDVDESTKEKIEKLINALEDHDDVQEVFHNASNLEEE